MRNIVNSPARLFLLFAFLFGGIAVVLIPPFATPDEPAHFLRTMELAQGGWWTRTALPPAVKAYADAGVGIDFIKVDTHGFIDNLHQIDKEYAEQRAQGKSVEIPYHRASIYSPAPYLPGVVMAWVAYRADMSLTATLYLVRASLCLVTILLMYMAIRIAPHFQWPLFLLGLFPITVYVRSSISADSLTLAYCVFFISYVLHCRSQGFLSMRQLWVLGILACLIALSKSAYALFLLLFFLFPASYFSGKAHYLKGVVLVIALPLALGIAWAWSVQQFFDPSTLPPVASAFPTNDIWHKPANVDEAGQLAYIKENPLNFTAMLVWVQLENALYYVYQMVGLVGKMDIELPWTLSYLMLLLTFFVYSKDTAAPTPLGIHGRALILGIFLMTYLGILTVVYIVFNPLHSSSILGIQGRYFLPLLPLLWLLIPVSPQTSGQTRIILNVIKIITFAQLLLCMGMVGVKYWH